MIKALSILGIRGLPAAHGGFETFAEHLALYLVEHGWSVTVYCQHDGVGDSWEDMWRGVTRINIPVRGDSPRSTMAFDWQCIQIAARRRELCLTLGYNTALFCSLLRLKGIPNLINMDGIEWSRAKWRGPAKAWFWLNDWAGCWVGNHLIADHPEIERHLMSRTRKDKITMIPYGADPVVEPDQQPVRAMGLEPWRYLSVIARAEPENSLLEVVQGFSAEPRGFKLVVLGNYDIERNEYHRAVRQAASGEVLFPGAIYDRAVVQSLRYYSAAYVHGHQVGGTNPSLVEALGAGNAVIAHGNRFNRWVAGPVATYFNSSEDLSAELKQLLVDNERLQAMRAASKARYLEHFTWGQVLQQYETLLLSWLPSELPLHSSVDARS